MKIEGEYCFNIGRRDETKNLESKSVFVSKERAEELARWIIEKEVK